MFHWARCRVSNKKFLCSVSRLVAWCVPQPDSTVTDSTSSEGVAPQGVSSLLLLQADAGSRSVRLSFRCAHLLNVDRSLRLPRASRLRPRCLPLTMPPAVSQNPLGVVHQSERWEMVSCCGFVCVDLGIFSRSFYRSKQVRGYRSELGTLSPCGVRLTPQRGTPGLSGITKAFWAETFWGG